MAETLPQQEFWHGYLQTSLAESSNCEHHSVEPGHQISGPVSKSQHVVRTACFYFGNLFHTPAHAHLCFVFLCLFPLLWTLNRLGFTQLTFTDILPMNCLLRKNFNHFDNLILSTMVPLMIAIILLLAALLLRRFEERQRRSGSQTARRSVECFASFLLLTFIVLPSASNTILRTFYCAEIATGDEWLVADYSIRCGTSQHRLHLVFCYIMIFIYPFGIPFLYMMLLYRHRKKINPKTDHYNALLLREKEEDSLYHIIPLLSSGSLVLWSGRFSPSHYFVCRTDWNQKLAPACLRRDWTFLFEFCLISRKRNLSALIFFYLYWFDFSQSCFCRDIITKIRNLTRTWPTVWIRSLLWPNCRFCPATLPELS